MLWNGLEIFIGLGYQAVKRVSETRYKEVDVSLGNIHHQQQTFSILNILQHPSISNLTSFIMKCSSIAGLFLLGVTTLALPSASIDERSVERAEDLDKFLAPMTYIGPITPGGKNHSINGTAEVSADFLEA